MQSLILLFLLLVLQPAVAGPRFNFCNLDVQRGQCKEKTRRWYYNKEDMRCYSFIYTGCGGNANSFSTWLKCEGTCGDICQKPIQPGLCEGSVFRFGYNKRSGRCERFKYSGCGGNKNNFRKRGTCRRVCESRCLLPVQKGRCASMKPRYFFNVKTGNCDMFIFSGCGGNANNFKNKKACEAKCFR